MEAEVCSNRSLIDGPRKEPEWLAVPVRLPTIQETKHGGCMSVVGELPIALQPRTVIVWPAISLSNHVRGCASQKLAECEASWLSIAMPCHGLIQSSTNEGDGDPMSGHA